MSEKISIIIPIYNVEKYLKKCIDSLIQQTYENIEIILVDDGSTDNSGRICDCYALNDNRIKVVHQKNGGVSSARNTGLRHSTGNYIGFVDPDDWIDKNMYERMLEVLKNNNSSISMCSYIYEYGDSKLNELKPDLVEQNLSSDELISKLFVPNSYYYTILCNKLYKANLWNGIKFPEGYVHEDEAVIHIIYDRCDQMSTISNEYYHYRMVNTSITHTNDQIRRIDFANALSLRLNYFYQRKRFDYCEKMLDEILYLTLNGFITKQLDKVSLHKIKKIIKSNFLKIIKEKKYSTKFKMSILICCFSPHLYGRIIK